MSLFSVVEKLAKEISLWAEVYTAAMSRIFGIKYGKPVMMHRCRHEVFRSAGNYDIDYFARVELPSKLRDKIVVNEVL